ncbi:hypothetical protein ABT040_35885 [Streptomyces sp. NPDC002688]|uniref:hypothetical protein n=1 Tax=Streptomyces sp. NPDC002688 TaxID=3154423 RepID=UPI003333BC05
MKATGKLLELGEEEALFGCDPLLVDPATGTRAMHRTLIPFQVAEGTSGGRRRSTRMPLPDERNALQLPDATPILHLAGVTHGTYDRPLIREELRVGADRAEVANRITAGKEPARRARG